MTTISFVVSAYNCRPWIAELLESIRAQTCPRDRLETIVIDAAPTPAVGTAADARPASPPTSVPAAEEALHASTLAKAAHGEAR